MLSKIIDGYFALAGILGSGFFIAAVIYLVYKLIRNKRFFILLISLIFLFLLILSPANIVLVSLMSVFLMTNSLFYIIFVIKWIFKRTKQNTSIDNYPVLTVFIPAKNESIVLEETINSIINVDYPPEKLNIIIINDNSSDNTSEILSSMQLKIKNLSVVTNTENLGKSESLNKVINMIDSEYILILDADHLIDKHFIKKALSHFTDSKVACVQASNSIRNGKDSFLAQLIEIEYASRFGVLYGGKSTALFMGTSALLKTECIKKAGGFDKTMLTEDLEISYRLYEHGYKIVYDDAISTFELSVTDFKNFFIQRHRWFRGIWQSFLHHIIALLKMKNVKSGLKITFFQIVIENLALAALLYMNILMSLDFFGIIIFPQKWVIIITTIMLFLVSLIGIIKVKKFELLIYMPFNLFTYILYGLPNIFALIDNFILKTEYKWNKTGRTTIAKAKDIPLILNISNKNE